jgi:DNA polymerase III alpha subunit
LDSIGASRERARGGHLRSQTATALHNALIDANEDGEGGKDLARYGDIQKLVGNLYDGHRSRVQAPGLGDAAIARSVRARARTGVRVEVAGLVINRQRPPTAAGFTFLTLEDETGLVNIIVNPKTFERHKRLILDQPVLLVAGKLEDEDGAIHVMANWIRAPGEVQMKTPPSNDWG